MDITYTANRGFIVPAGCKVMALCDDTVETVAGSELLLNPGPFIATTNWTGINATLSVAANELIITSDGVASEGRARQGIATVVGARYKLWTNCRRGTAPSGGVGITANGIESISHDGISNAVVQMDFTATSTTTIVDLFFSHGGAPAAGQTAYFVFCSARIVDSDISGNDKGLAAYGSITKAVTATNATTVSYGPFSASNYLYQPYNADMDFGTSDFYIGCWVKVTDLSNFNFIVSRGYYSGSWSGPLIELYLQYATGIVKFRISDDAGLLFDEVFSTTAVFAGGDYVFIWAQRSGGNIQIYYNGRYESQTVISNASGMLSNSIAELYVGQQAGGSNPAAGFFSGLRIGTGSLTVEQIKSIYNSEKHLFKPNSVFRIFGSTAALSIAGAKIFPDYTEIGPPPIITLDGEESSVIHRIDETWQIVTDRIEPSAYYAWVDFKLALAGSAQFTLDPYADGDIKTCVKMGEVKLDRVGNGPYWRASFTARVLP